MDRTGAEGEHSRAWAADVARAILEFFDHRHRALPWRDTDDPYRIWVSEVMLQQTRVETVIPYYERWLERFPDLERLAAAAEDEVLGAWAGLGYYSRARNLHRAARHVRERLHGDVPRTAAALRELPGVGEYTAGAIASIAFGEPAPAIDGNARRVLSRLLDANLAPTALQEAGRRLVPAERPGDFNQGLMELGATICAPRRPRCERCPLADLCRARAAGTQALRPAPKTRAPLPRFRFLTLVAHTRTHVLLQRRTERLLHGLWCFPALPLDHERAVAGGAPAAGTPGIATDAGRAAAAVRRLLRSRVPPAAIGTLEHAFSHRVEHYAVFRVTLSRRVKPAATSVGQWLPRARLPDLAMPAAQRRIAALAGLQD